MKGEITISRYEGVRFAEWPRKGVESNPKDFNAILLTGKTGECDGCGEKRFLRFLDSAWLCNQCAIYQLEEDLASEKPMIEYP